MKIVVEDFAVPRDRAAIADADRCACEDHGARINIGSITDGEFSSNVDLTTSRDPHVAMYSQ